MLELQRPLRRFWNVDAYLADGVEHAAGTASVDVTAIDDALESPLFWARLITLDFLFSMVRRCFAWAEGCACHSHLDHTSVSPEVRERWRCCPLAGLRLPELAAGDFFESFQHLFEVTVPSCLLALPTDISAEE